MEKILEIKDLSKKYPGFNLDRVSFSLDKGFVMGFIGPNGAGKTTTIKLIMNLVRRDSGDIRIVGRDNIKDEVQVKREIGFVYEDCHFYEELTGRDFAKVVSSLYPRWDQAAFAGYMGEFGLPENKKIKELSRGMRMKLSLAIALSHQARLLIMDEPTSGLDPVFRSELLDILRGYMTEERSILFSTHVTSDLDKIADIVTLIHEGRVVFSKSREELLENYVLVKGEKKYLDDNLKKNLLGLRESSYGFEGLTAEAAAIHRRWGDSLLFEKASLEDIMLFTVRGNK